ncbi:hypothetical protein [Methanogenium cariaci]|uniref:hypothetical protein n=1 Tax=Methanogenium cariaci TaxID=2197 RepID=UPI000780B157|nr:hypothetical protein [Methanogenium cariaci]
MLPSLVRPWHHRRWGGPDLLSLPAGGSTADLTITLDGVTAGLSGYNLSLTLNPTGIAEIVAVGYPDWGEYADERHHADGEHLDPGR